MRQLLSDPAPHLHRRGHHQDRPAPGNECTIYDVRPEKCQGYPFTDKPDFAFSTINHANNAVACTAVFYVVEQIKRQVS
jgi:Fe-S-cluster containining protein